MFDSYAGIQALVVSRIRTGLGLPDEIDVILGRPLAEQKVFPAVVVTCEATREFNGVRSVAETFEFEISAFWQWEDASIVQNLQAEKIAALGEELLEIGWEQVGAYLPQFRSPQFLPSDFENGVYGISALFSVISDVEQ